MTLRPRHILAAILGFAVVAACASLALADTLNSFRHAHGLAPLHHSRAMQAMAQRHANSMAARQSMDHDGFYTQRAPRGARAENVGWGCPTAGCVMKLWEESAGHRANMLRSDIRSYGMASAARGGRRYWCMELGR
jgi:uncharacterized protein YkwD